jgi:7-cyano-7-deazaguanine synthase
MSRKALVILSGGQDSTTCLGWALANYEEVGCVTFDYGQKHVREIVAAEDVVKYFRKHTGKPIPHEVVYFLPGVLAGTSPLTNPAEALETYADHDSMAVIIGDRVEKTFVPMRNSLFLVVAANRAVVGDYDVLVTGVCQSDNANYPDCTASFIKYMRDTINTGLGNTLSPDGDAKGYPLEIETPLMDMTKPETVRLALSLPNTYGALAFSHTAYDGTYPPTSKDHASVLRAHGFEQADRPDPLVLRAVWEGLMPLPATANYSESHVAAFTHAMCADWGQPRDYRTGEGCPVQHHAV